MYQAQDKTKIRLLILISNHHVKIHIWANLEDQQQSHLWANLEDQGFDAYLMTLKLLIVSLPVQDQYITSIHLTHGMLRIPSYKYCTF